jgi:hypothetical protein
VFREQAVGQCLQPVYGQRAVERSLDRTAERRLSPHKFPPWLVNKLQKLKVDHRYYFANLIETRAALVVGGSGIL